MPLFFEQKTHRGGVLGIWRITEDEDYFIKRSANPLVSDEELVLIKGTGRRLQWLSARHLIGHLVQDLRGVELIKDEFGKPHLKDSKLFISISHSNEFAAALVAPVSCGIDIQYIVPKIRRIVPRFCSPTEKKHIKSNADLKTMHIIWGAKECIYKSYGRKQVDYKRDILIENPHKLLERPGKGHLQTKNSKYTYEVFASDVLDYVLTYCFKSEDL